MVISVLSIWSPCDIIHLRYHRNLSRKASWMNRRYIRTYTWLTSCFPHCCPYVIFLKGMELRGTSWSQERIFLSYRVFWVQLCRGNHFETGRKRKYELSNLKECVCLIELTKTGIFCITCKKTKDINLVTFHRDNY